jgi:amino acid adenylation domain-containing protein
MWRHWNREILRRHEVLRTVFKSEQGNPVQVVVPDLTIRIRIFDLRGLVSEEKRWAEVRRMSREEAQRPFDLAIGPLLRIALVRLADGENVLLRSMHHIVSDGWSEGVLFRELKEIYEALSNGKPPPLAELPVQYADYAVWQRQWFQGERLETQLSYWKKQLENISTLQLPTDRPRPANPSPRGERQYFALSHELSSGLKELSNQHGVTLFMTLLAAFQTLLHRYSGQTDIVVGSPVAGRSRREFEELIGFFLNTLVLRLDLSSNPTFAEAIGRVREVCLGALSHQELPFEKLVEELHPDRNLGHNPLFQVSFAFQNTPRFSPQLSNIKVDELQVETGIARFDLHLFMEEIDGHLKGYCDYDTNLFNADTIESLLDHFQTLLESVVRNPDQRVTEIPILTEAEKHQLLVEWNDTRRDYPEGKCIHQLFEEQVEKSPDAVAVVFENQQLTYRELNTRANQLAHYLRNLGVGPELLVGICMERSLEMLIGLLGILKAGGAYVPLDPAYPKDRLAFMLNDSKAAILLTRENPLAGVSEHKAQVVRLNRDYESIARKSETNPASEVTADNLAYLIYTSGSTGRPKGVAIEHHSPAALLHWARGVFPPEDLAGVLASTSICFDLSVFEFFVPLCSGGKVILADNALALPSLSAATEVTLINTVPSAITELLKVDGVPASVRTVNLAGEPLSATLVEQLYQVGTIERVYDLYGPSEYTTYSTFALRRSQGPTTIGRPIANTQVYVLDNHLRPVPIGVFGELYIGGEGLARGYCNNPELTAEGFPPHPFSSGPGERVYRTGDLARYLDDGNIEFLGRIDHQVKVRGFRIELGEIEAVLCGHPQISGAVVVVREDAPGDKRLVGYVANREPVPIGDLRSFLNRKLPDYMIPSVFVFLDSLPLTSSGKVDRKALPAPDQSRPELEESFVAPFTPLEEALARIWAGVLGLERVGIHDNFFDLGGHSLLATQMMARVRGAFQVDVPLRALFEKPTVGELATVIAGQKAIELDGEEFSSTLAELESLSEEETQRLLLEQGNYEGMKGE